MKPALALVAAAGHRLAYGTGLLLHGLGDALAPGGFGPLILRSGGALAVLAFVGRLLQRAPQLVYAVPVVWLLAAWHMSDSSATPPPGEGRPSCSECAGHELVSVTPLGDRAGMLIYKTSPADHPNHTHIHIEHTP